MSFRGDKDKAFQVYTLRLPIALHTRLSEAAARRYEPASVLVRRLIERELTEGTRG